MYIDREYISFATELCMCAPRRVDVFAGVRWQCWRSERRRELDSARVEADDGPRTWNSRMGDMDCQGNNYGLCVCGEC